MGEEKRRERGVMIMKEEKNERKNVRIEKC